jgi:hypothetical protein
VWLYEKGNYDLLRRKMNLVNWVELQDDDIDTYVENITNTNIKNIKHVKIKPNDPPWMNNQIIKNKAT